MNPIIEAESKKNTANQVVYAWNYLSWGGAQIYFLGLIKEARKYFNVRVLLPEGSDEQLLKFLRDEKVQYDFFGPAFVPPVKTGLAGKFQTHFSKIKSEFAMLKALKRYDLERAIVHIELAPWQSLSSLIWLCLRTTVFITMHNSLPRVAPYRKALWKLKLRIISRFKTFHPFASNVDSKDYFKGLYSDRVYEGILVTYTNVNPDEIAVSYDAEIDSKAIRRSNGLRENSFLVICVGQFVDRKGRWTFLEACKRLLPDHDDIDFAWVSNSPLSDADLSRIESYGLGDRFKLVNSDEIGPQHSDLFNLVRTANAFVLPSFVEGLPISLLEAMALGLPCISTRINAIPEAVIDGETGCLIDAGDSEALAETVLTLRDNPRLCDRIGKAGRKLVLSKFNEKEVAKIAVRKYLDVSERKG